VLHRSRSPSSPEAVALVAVALVALFACGPGGTAESDADSDVSRETTTSDAGSDTGDTGDTAQPSLGPPLVDLPRARDLDPSAGAVEVVLRVAEATTDELRPGVDTAIVAYHDGAGTLDSWHGPVGPLIQARVGDQITIHLDNDLVAEATTLHLHGVRLPAAVDGNPAVEGGLFPGERRTYTFTARDPGLFWYHPHINTAGQMAAGLKGPLLIAAEVEPPVAAERVLVIDALSLTADGAALESAEGLATLVGPRDPILVVNGRPRPFIRAVAGARERWRLVNASSHRRLHLRPPSGEPWIILGEDTGALQAPRETALLDLAPGERVDVLVDLVGDSGQVLTLAASEVDAGHGSRDPEAALLDILLDPGVPGLTADPGLFTDSFQAIEVDLTTPSRDLILSADLEGPDAPIFFVNGEQWPFNAPIELGLDYLEIWRVTNESVGYHPVHLHGTFFQVLAGDVGDPAYGWKDTLELAPGSTVRLAVRFDEPGHWMFHCQTPSHAERGMMADVFVTEAP
jgi:FtsP/CotA-like multicopper oxidase with cupredoxin domain